MRCKFVIFALFLIFLIVLSLEITFTATSQDAASCQLCSRWADNNNRAKASWRCVNFDNTFLQINFSGDVDGNDDFDFKVNCANQEIQQECKLCRRFNDNCGSNCVHNASWKCVNFNNTALLTDFVNDVNSYDYFDLKVDCSIPELQTGCQLCRRFNDNCGSNCPHNTPWNCVNFNNTALLTNFVNDVNNNDYFDLKVSCASCGNNICESNLGENTKNCQEDCPCTVPVDIVLVLDRSGSMVLPPEKIADAKTATKNFVDLMNNTKDYIGLVSFGGSVTLDQSLTLDYNALKIKIDSLVADHATPMGQAILMAKNEITSHGRANVKHTIVLLSDGMPTINATGSTCDDDVSSPTSCTDYALQQATAAKNAGIAIYTVGLGLNGTTPEAEFARNLMKNISSSPEYFYNSPTSSELLDLFKALAGIVCPAHKCSNSSQVIVRLSDSTNALGEVWNEIGDYPWEICYDEIFNVSGIRGSCNGANKVLGLSAQTNALASIPENPSSTDVCYGNLICVSTPENCSTLGEDYRMVVSLSENSGANLSSENDLLVKICCKVAIQMSLASANWTDIDENVISQATTGQEVWMFTEGVPGGTLINFSITQAGNQVTSKTSSISNGKAKTTWNASIPGIYRFNASVVSNTSISITSGDLDVSSWVCSPLDCQQTLESLNDDRAVDIWGSWNNGTCSGSIDCGDCSIGTKIIDTELNPNGGICIKSITYCSDYNITNFGSLLSAKGNCTKDPLNVAVDTIEIEQGKGSNWCGSLDGSDCTRTCICNWTTIDGTEQCVGISGRNDCPNSGDNGICNLIGQSLLKDCDLPPIGFRNITYYYNWIGTNPDPECKNANVLTRCISRTTLGFSSTSALVIAVIIIVVFYLIVIRKPGKKKTRKK